jgi:addiction module HigA family antidote
MKNRKQSQQLANITPGEILLEDFLKPMGITQYRLAKEIGVPARRINEVVHGKRAITADTALRLGRFFNMAPEFWTNLQSHYELEQEMLSLGNRLAREVKPWKKLAAQLLVHVSISHRPAKNVRLSMAPGECA